MNPSIWNNCCSNQQVPVASSVWSNANALPSPCYSYFKVDVPNKEDSGSCYSIRWFSYPGWNEMLNIGDAACTGIHHHYFQMELVANRLKCGVQVQCWICGHRRWPPVIYHLVKSSSKTLKLPASGGATWGEFIPKVNMRTEIWY